MTGLLEGKNVLITGVITEASMAFHTARIAIEQGATVVLTGFGRVSLVERIAKRLPGDPCPSSNWTSPTPSRSRRWPNGSASTCRRSTACCTRSASPRRPRSAAVFLETPWEDVATAVHASTYSLKALAVGCLPLMGNGGSIVGLDFDARQAWPAYDWMGVAKAGLESCSRYLARDLGPKGIRVNLVSAGPIRTMAAKSIPGFGALEDAWTKRAPLGWDTSDPTPVAQACVALLSDWFPATSGSMVMVDGGFSALGFSSREITD